MTIRYSTSSLDEYLIDNYLTWAGCLCTLLAAPLAVLLLVVSSTTWRDTPTSATEQFCGQSSMLYTVLDGLAPFAPYCSIQHVNSALTM